MKTYTIHPKADDILHRFPALGKRLSSLSLAPAPVGAPRVLSFGGDLEAAEVCMAVQAGLS